MPEPRVLLCLGPCRGEFYLPLKDGQEPTCPNDADHLVAVYKLEGVLARYRPEEHAAL